MAPPSGARAGDRDNDPSPQQTSEKHRTDIVSRQYAERSPESPSPGSDPGRRFDVAFMAELRARADIVEVVERYVALRKEGLNHKGLCPFHGEKSPSFIVSPSRQTYYCFGCGEHGDVFDVLMKLGGRDFVDAVRELAQQAGMVVPTGAGERAAHPARRRTVSAAQLLLAIEEEVHIAFVVASDVLHNREVSEADFDRLNTAVARIGAAREELRS